MVIRLNVFGKMSVPRACYENRSFFLFQRVSRALLNSRKTSVKAYNSNNHMTALCWYLCPAHQFKSFFGLAQDLAHEQHFMRTEIIGIAIVSPTYPCFRFNFFPFPFELWWRNQSNTQLYGWQIHSRLTAKLIFFLAFSHAGGRARLGSVRCHQCWHRLHF